MNMHITLTPNIQACQYSDDPSFFKHLNVKKIICIDIDIGDQTDDVKRGDIPQLFQRHAIYKTIVVARILYLYYTSTKLRSTMSTTPVACNGLCHR